MKRDAQDLVPIIPILLLGAYAEDSAVAGLEALVACDEPLDRQVLLQLPARSDAQFLLR